MIQNSAFTLALAGHGHQMSVPRILAMRNQQRGGVFHLEPKACLPGLGPTPFLSHLHPERLLCEQTQHPTPSLCTAHTPSNPSLLSLSPPLLPPPLQRRISQSFLLLLPMTPLLIILPNPQRLPQLLRLIDLRLRQLVHLMRFQASPR